MKKQYDWSIIVPPAYPTEEQDKMCRVLERQKIIRARPSKLNPKEIIITTEER